MAAPIQQSSHAVYRSQASLQSNEVESKIEHERMKANLKEQTKRAEIAFEVERDEESGWLTASWDAPRGQGGITTQGRDLRELEQNVREAVCCHFENGKRL